ncbi:MAG TPA: NAD(P)-binding domain-containing protein, partial [Tepidisphaeraceae bacterium]|nr:NAD(P)-binding domain-containing protein [Tepidisphaeraceae bacterium]
MAQRLAFVGTGIMGEPMAGHLLRGGHAVVVHNRTRGKAAALLAAGASWADSPAAAARGADVVFVCVTDTPDVRRVLLERGGVIDAARAGLVVVDHSTISPSATRDIAAALADGGVTLLDA